MRFRRVAANSLRQLCLPALFNLEDHLVIEMLSCTHPSPQPYPTPPLLGSWKVLTTKYHIGLEQLQLKNRYFKVKVNFLLWLKYCSV